MFIGGPEIAAGKDLLVAGGEQALSHAPEIAQVTANRAAGQVGERFLADTYGSEQPVSRLTSSGRRFIDNLSNGVAQESKVGRAGLTSRIVSQINKDRELLDTPGNGIDSVEWHFFPSSTGVGPTAQLEEVLLAQGIDVVVH